MRRTAIERMGRITGRAKRREARRFRADWRWIFYLLAPGLLWLAVRSLDWPALLGGLQKLELTEIAILALVNLGILVALSGRWWILLRGLGHPISLFNLTIYRVAAFAISYFTPGPHFGGEPLQAHLIWRRHGLEPGRALASVLLDKLIELIANFGFLLVGSVVLIVLPASGSVPVWLIAVPVLLLVLPLVYMAKVGRGAAPLSGVIPRLGSGASKWLRVSDLLETVRKAEVEAGQFWRKGRPAAALAVFWSLLSWAVLLGEYFLMLRFLGISVNGWELLAMLTAARLALLLPFPGGLGALELGQMLAFDVLAHSPEAGIAVALLIRARDVLVGAAGLAIGAQLLRN